MNIVDNEDDFERAKEIALEMTSILHDKTSDSVVVALQVCEMLFDGLLPQLKEIDPEYYRKLKIRSL